MAHSVAAGLVRRGHAVRVQTAALKGLPPHELRDGVDIFRTFAFRRRADSCSVPEMAAYLATSLVPSLRHIQSWKPHVVHAHFAVPTGALALACRGLTGLPYVLTAHLGDLPGGNPEQTDALFRTLNPLIRPIWQSASAVSASSSFAAGLAQSAYGLDPAIIRNGLPMSDLASAPSPTNHPPSLVAAGRFHPQKNFLWMVRALQSCDFPWRLSLIGDGPQRAEIESGIRLAGIADRVALLGWVPEPALRSVFSQADILLMPSTSEGNPVAAIEALKHGLAILGSDIGGLSDLIENGFNGFAVPLHSPDAFQSRLRLLCSDDALLLQMKSGSLKIAKRFDLEAIVDQFEEILARAARQGDSRTHIV